MDNLGQLSVENLELIHNRILIDFSNSGRAKHYLWNLIDFSDSGRVKRSVDEIGRGMLAATDFTHSPWFASEDQ